MRAALVAAFAVALVGCGDLFTPDAPEGYGCSTSGTCPPGQQCVPGEHVCRTPCTQTTMTTSGNNGQCSGINGGNSTSNTGYACDYDHFCRPMCIASGGNGCGGCTGGAICDATVNICRPACTGGCPSSWGCTDVGNGLGGGGFGTNDNNGICAACRPTAMTTLEPPVFADPVFYDGAAGAHANTIAAGDLHGNGHASVVVVDTSGQKIYVFANDGSGALDPPVAYAAAPKPFDAIVADMNRDGKNDVVVATVLAGAGGPVLFPGNGDGTLGAVRPSPGAIPSTRLTLGDFDGDGKPEVAMCGSGTGQLTVVGADGAGGLKTLATFAQSGGNASFVHVGTMDFNGDKKLDLWGDDEHGGINPYLGNGSFGFNMGMMTTNSGPRADAINFDVDGDGKDDYVLVTANPDLASTTTSVVVLHNGGNAMFNQVGNYSVSLPDAGHIVAGDFDGDGKIDAAMLENTGTTKANVDFLSNDGEKLVWSEQIAIGKDGPSSIAVADVDGDGKPDLVVGLGSGGVAVLLNQTPSR